MHTQTLLEVKNLTVTFPHAGGARRVVDGIDLLIHRGETFGIVGESGSGKTMTALSLIRLVPYPAEVSADAIIFDGTDMRTYTDAALRAVRGARIATVFQDPSSSLNPVLTIGAQVVEALCAHTPDLDRPHAQSRVLQMFQSVHIAQPERIFHDYPHQLSGGIKQRVMIAMALINNPELLILDEPTTALDVTIQAQILDLLDEIKKRTHVAMIFISHDFGVIARVCDTVAVMRQGRIVETGPTREILHHPRNLYTQSLLDSVKALA